MRTIHYAMGKSSLGLVLAAWSNAGLAAVFLGDSRSELEGELRGRFNHDQLVEGGPERAAYLDTVTEAVEGRGTSTQFVLDLGGTEFQRKVWQALRAIPAGATASYQQVAAAIDAPGSARAVAQACGANPVAVIVPCHRVVRADGSLSGYHWGLDRKRQLLEREGAR